MTLAVAWVGLCLFLGLLFVAAGFSRIADSIKATAKANDCVADAIRYVGAVWWTQKQSELEAMNRLRAEPSSKLTN